MSEIELPPDPHDGAGIWRDPSGIIGLGEDPGSRVKVEFYDHRCIVLCRHPAVFTSEFDCPSCKKTAVLLGGPPPGIRHKVQVVGLVLLALLVVVVAWASL